ncbi:hypothetical protein [Cohnella lupini]|uniref:PAP2 superfamily protein n=1 Tax=Cohnella lupini TaxID=1294267 RepID=A0A3D9IWV8_9BACL|nr:hypothetical protein [Cohnella lupini]RED66232.1 hypothetical protein DFP95_101730 [Cohnella lupini]
MATSSTDTQARSAGDKIAYAISFLFNPLLIAVPLYLIVALHTAANLSEGLAWWLVISLGVSLAPILFIRRGVAKGKFTDHDVSRREQRLLPFLFTLACLAIALVVLLALDVSIELLATFTGMLATIVVALLITQWASWKISLHLIGVTGAVLTLGLLISSTLYLLTPLVVVVGWARWRLKAHTAMQAVAGAAVATGVTLISFRLFGL